LCDEVEIGSYEAEREENENEEVREEEERRRAERKARPVDSLSLQNHQSSDFVSLLNYLSFSQSF
jgi:hypothetical protein